MVMTIPKDVDMTFDDSAREKANKELTNLHSQVAPWPHWHCDTSNPGLTKQVKYYFMKNSSS